jgi:hypothetical protein
LSVTWVARLESWVETDGSIRALVYAKTVRAGTCTL